MIFKGPAGYGRIANILMNLVMCSALSFFVLFTAQNLPGNEGLPILTPLGFFVSLVLSFCVGMLVGDLVPALAWGYKLVAALKIRNKVGAYFVSTLVLDIVMVTCISFICSWINNIQTVGLEGTLAAWLMVYPVLLAGGYVVMLIFLNPFQRIASLVSGFDPASVQQQEAATTSEVEA